MSRNDIFIHYLLDRGVISSIYLSAEIGASQGLERQGPSVHCLVIERTSTRYSKVECQIGPESGQSNVPILSSRAFMIYVRLQQLPPFATQICVHLRMEILSTNTDRVLV